MMGCIFSVNVRNQKCTEAGKSSSGYLEEISDPKKRTSQQYSLRAAILIQKWYRRYQARLEIKRRCAWMIYQTLEYAGEQSHLKLYNLFNDLIEIANQRSITINQPETQTNDADSEIPIDLRIWEGKWVPSVPPNYDGLKLHFPLDMPQVAAIMDHFSRGKKLHPSYIFEIVNQSRQSLLARPNIQIASTSISKYITVVGDLHGQFNDLQIILFKNGMPDVTNPYIFNGDFVDRGKKSVETILIILCLLLIRPTAVFLNRGNHEDHYVNCQYGFIKEVQKKYKSIASALISCFSELYRYLPLATIIDNKIFVCHGGISSETDLDVLGKLNRFSYQDLLWSDPSPQSGLRANERRGLGCSFGPDITKYILNKYDFNLIIRSHECKPDGFEWSHDKKLLTVFSASNYYTEGSNRGAYARVNLDGSVHPIQYITGGKKLKTVRQTVSSAEESALTDLKQKISANSTELRTEFLLIDPNSTGFISISDWCKIMENVLDLKLPWRTIQPRLVIQGKMPNTVEYLTTFQNLTVCNLMAQSTPSVTEEMYKNRDILEGIFRAMDKDNSGHISLTEFQTACLRLPNRSQMDEQTIMELARSIDLNKDGLIDFNEFLETFRLVELDHEKYENIGDS